MPTHDFALTATKAVFVLHPISLPRIPVALMTGRKSFGESLRWQPKRGTVVLSVDRQTGERRKYKTGPLLTFHTANAWDEDGDVVWAGSPRSIFAPRKAATDGEQRSETPSERTPEARS